jgi:predicted metal-binding membrane protein
MTSERVSDQVFFGASALLFAASAAMTIVWCGSMSAMGGMPMLGGWTMSMAWMPGQTWAGAAAMFLGMWIVMMAAMMLPSLVPILWRYRQAISRTGVAGLGWLTVVFGVGYFTVWAALGIVVFPTGALLAAVEMQSSALARAVPISAGVLVLIGGVLQFTPWKTHHLACCRNTSVRGRALRPEAGAALRHGLRLGFHCCCCCAGLMAMLLVIGLMDLRAMAVVTAAIAIERLAPGGERLARVTGAIAVASGIFLIARPAGLH